VGRRVRRGPAQIGARGQDDQCAQQAQIEEHDQVVPQAIDTGQRDAVEGHAAQEKSDRQQRLGDGAPEPGDGHSNSTGAMLWVSSRSNSSISSFAVSLPRADRVSLITRSIMGAACWPNWAIADW